MSTTAKRSLVIDTYSRKGAYEMHQCFAIVDSAKHGRLLLVEGFGGMDSTRGGMYRWSHGMCYKIYTTVTSIESLLAEDTESGYSDLQGMIPFEWSGSIVDRLAKSFGL